MAVGLLVLSMGRGDAVSDIRLAVGAYEQDLVRWELTHFMDKWVHRVVDVLPFVGPDNDEERRQQVLAEFFDLGGRLGRAQVSLQQAAAADDATPDSVLQGQAEVEELLARRAALQGVVEETLEAAISKAALETGVISSIGPLRWPPVDFTFEPGALVLVRSPKDRIARMDDLLLDSDIMLLDQIALEEEVEALDDETSALIVRIGGVATYPAQVSPNLSLHGTLMIAAHEYLHHWMIFKPLGRQWFSGGELQVINETVANMFGEEIGDRAYEILTGQPIERQPWQPPTIQPRQEVEEGVFDFTREMRKTRTQVELMLGAGKVREAEEYLEQRRLVFVSRGYAIRKLNTAWFAFFGTYGDSAASISPIEGQLRAIRADSADLPEFLDRVSVIDERGELEKMAIAAGWKPIDVRTGLPL